MSSLDNGTIEAQFTNAFQLTLGSNNTSILDTTIETPKENNPIAHNRNPIPSIISDDIDPMLFDKFSEEIRDNITVLNPISPKEEKIQKNDIKSILQILDVLHDNAPDIAFDSLQIMVSGSNGDYKTTFLSLFDKYGNPEKKEGSTLTFFYNKEKEKFIALGIWKNIDEEGTERKGYVWNIRVKSGQSIMVQNLLFQKLEYMYKGSNSQINKQSNGKDFSLVLQKKGYKYAIAFHTESSLQ
jgi:hypothetical protein